MDKMGVSIEVAYVREEVFKSSGHAPPANLLENEFIQDGGFGGGPCHYKEIFAIRTPRKESYRNPKTGAVSVSEKTSRKLLGELDKIGQLPIEVNDEYIIIHGYKK